MLIGLTGYAQHGKDTIAQVLVDEYGFRQVAFAEPLKRLAYELNPTVEGIGRLQSIVDAEGWDKAKQWPEVRRLLQVLGTSARDILGPDTWVHAAERVILASGPDVVVSDCRFHNEFRFIARMGGELWRVTRPGFDNGVGIDHPSEQFVHEARPAFEFTNNYASAAEFATAVKTLAGLQLGRVPVWQD